MSKARKLKQKSDSNMSDPDATKFVKDWLKHGNEAQLVFQGAFVSHEDKYYFVILGNTTKGDQFTIVLDEIETMELSQNIGVSYKEYCVETKGDIIQ